MQTPKWILVLGATGKQGGAVVKHLLASGWKVRALTRKPNTEKVNALKQQSVDVVVGDMEDPPSLEKAMEDVYGAFSVQNFWECGYEAEIRQGKNVADAAKSSNVKHIVYTSVGGAERKTGLPHFESKWMIEEYIRSLGLPHTIIRPVSFMDNYFMMKEVIMNGVLPSPGKPDKPQQLVAVDDIGAAVARAFANPEKFVGEAIEFASDELTPVQIAEVFSSVLGRQIEHVQTPLEEMRKFRGEEIAKMIEWMDRDGYKANIPRLRENYGFQLTSLGEWLRKTGWV